MSTQANPKQGKATPIFRRIMGAMMAVAALMAGLLALTSVLTIRALDTSVEESSGRLAEHSMEKDLNVALKLMSDHTARIDERVSGFARRAGVIEAFLKHDEATLRERVNEPDAIGTHFFTVLDAKGVVIARRTGSKRGDSLADHPLVRRALQGTPSVGLWLEAPNFLEREQLADRARTKVLATPGAADSSKSVEERGLVAIAVHPVRSPSGQPLGVIMGGYLHNHDYHVVDVLRQTIYKDMESVGTATIFLDDVRVSTNVTDTSGQRAIGTRLSKQVGDAVLKQGVHYRGRAFVVRDWYMAGYEPLRDILGDTIGVLYVGVLEGPIKQPFRNMYTSMRNTSLVLLGIGILLSSALALALSSWLGRRISKPITSMTTEVQRLANGDLTVEITDPDQDDELGQLQRVMKAMTVSLREMVRGSREGINALTSSTAQIAVTSKQSQATAAEQATAVQEVGSTIQEIGSTSKAVLDRAQEVVEMSEHAVEAGQRGVQAVGEAQRGLELLTKVAEIVDTVNELAEQSNVLAVNAAIEAAKAGERGKGFAVVAGEVRSLAGQSKKAARQIREILSRVESSGTAIGHASTVIRELGEVLDHTADKARQIAAAAGQQAAGMAQIGTAMEQVVQGGRDTADGARQLQSAVNNLNVLANDLNQKAARYKI